MNAYNVNLYMKFIHICNLYMLISIYHVNLNKVNPHQTQKHIISFKFKVNILIENTGNISAYMHLKGNLKWLKRFLDSWL